MTEPVDPAEDLLAALCSLLAADDRTRQAVINRLIGASEVSATWPPSSINLNDGNWLTREQAAHQARCSIETIKRRIEAGDIAVKVGGKWWVDRRRLIG